MSIPYTLKVNERQIASPIVGESHIIGIVGITTYAPGQIRLVEVPQLTVPFSTVMIPGYTEIPSGTPIGTQFLVDYETGVVSFSPTHDGSIVSVSYEGLGSEIAAEDVNEVQDPLNSIVQLNITYNWPLPPTVSWSLSANSVTNSSIAAFAAIDYSKLNLTNSILSTDVAPGQVVKSLNSLTDAVTLAAGTNITITPSGNTLTISAAATAVGVSSIHADSSPNLTGAVHFVSGTNVTLAQVGQDITINATASGSGANVSLSNLSTVAINTSLLPGVDNTVDLGSSSKNFHTLFVKDGVDFQQTNAGVNNIFLKAPAIVNTTYTLNLPADQGASSTFLQNDGFGNLVWAPGADGITSLTGDVITTTSSSTLGTAGGYAVLASSTITNTGFSVLTGDLGLSPGTSVTGFPPGTVSGTQHIADAAAAQAIVDATNAYNTFSTLPFPPGAYPGGNDLSGQDLGSIAPPPPGVYSFSSAAFLTGTLTLNGTASDVWVFEIGSTLITGSFSTVVMTGGAVPRNVYWMVGSSATLNASSQFQGIVIAQSSITLVTNASNMGNLIALTGAVTLDTNNVTATSGGSSTTVATVVSVGGSSAANIHTAELLANGATSSNVPNTIVKRDTFGNFSANAITTVGTITAVGGFIGHASLDLALAGGALVGSLGIGGAADPSAMLDVQSITKGFLPPRMPDPLTDIASPAEGLIAYNTTTHQWLGYDGTSWVILG